MVTGVTNKINLSNHRFEIKKIFKPLLKEKIKHIKFHQFFNYCTHNKIEIKVYPKIRVKANLEEVPLSSMKNSKSISFYKLNFLNLS